MAFSLYGWQVLADGAQGYYRMNEAFGTVAHDLTSNHNDATLSSVSAYSQPGVLFNDGDTAITFAGGGTLTLPSAFNNPAWSVFSVEFWHNGIYKAWTIGGANALFYQGGAPQGMSVSYVPRIFGSAVAGASGNVPTLSTIVTWLASYVTASTLDEVALYKYVLLPMQIYNHYYIGTAG